MTITLRSVKGSNLTVAELDGNFTDLDGRVSTLESNPPDANSVANITTDGTTVTFFLDDGTQFTGTLPTAVFAWRGDWAGATAYFTNDVVVVTGDGVYLVLQDHTSEATFDADEANSDGDYYFKMIGAGADGADGTNGTNGTNGTDGATWLTGAGEPDPGLGTEGDFYFDQGLTDGTGEGDAYQHQGSDGWVLIANVKGETGDTGPQGPTGAGSTIIVDEGGVGVGDPVSNLNFDADDFDVVEDTSGTVTVSLADGAGGAVWSVAGSWSHSVSGNIANFNVDVTGADEIMVQMLDVQTSVSGTRQVLVSDDGGSTFKTSGYRAPQDTGGAGSVNAIPLNSASSTLSRGGSCIIYGAGIASHAKWVANLNMTGICHITPSMGAINRVRVNNSGGGNMTSGSIVVLKR